MTGQEADPLRQVPLADGSLVQDVEIWVAMTNVEEALLRLGALAAIDLRDLAEGRQPAAQPFGDTRSLFLGLGLCTERSDGSLGMHDLTADVVRNAVHVNPDDASDFRLTDPRVPFQGFDAQPGE